MVEQAVESGKLEVKIVTSLLRKHQEMTRLASSQLLSWLGLLRTSTGNPFESLTDGESLLTLQNMIWDLAGGTCRRHTNRKKRNRSITSNELQSHFLCIHFLHSLFFPNTFIGSAIHILFKTNVSQVTHPSIFQTIHDDIVSRRYPQRMNSQHLHLEIHFVPPSLPWQIQPR